MQIDEKNSDPMYFLQMLLRSITNNPHSCTRHRNWISRWHLDRPQKHKTSSHRRLWHHRIPRRGTSHESTSKYLSISLYVLSVFRKYHRVINLPSLGLIIKYLSNYCICFIYEILIASLISSFNPFFFLSVSPNSTCVYRMIRDPSCWYIFLRENGIWSYQNCW